jgi:hypothetical protein
VEGAQNADAVKFVVSAYVQRNPLAKRRLPSVSFETLIVKAVQGEPITSPKKAPPSRSYSVRETCRRQNPRHPCGQACYLIRAISGETYVREA